MPKKGHGVNEKFGWIDKVSPLTGPVVIGKAMMEVMEALANIKKGNEDVVCRSNVGVIGSISINMRCRIDKADSMGRNGVSENVDKKSSLKGLIPTEKG